MSGMKEVCQQGFEGYGGLENDERQAGSRTERDGHACALMWSLLGECTCGVAYSHAEISSPRTSYRCSDAGI